MRRGVGFAKDKGVLDVKFKVTNRYTGKVQFIADIDCGDDLPKSEKFRLAVLWALKNKADLSGANFSGADLYGASLRGADLSGADLYGANLSGADLYGASLRGAKNIPEIVKAETLITQEGDIIGWKKCCHNVIVKLMIPSAAKRHNATGRKCRAEYADVVEVIGGEVGVSRHDGKTEYRVGKRVHCDSWGEDRFNECAGGIHFFITREEAGAY